MAILCGRLALGQISRAGQSIVCLPAHIVITLAGADADYDLITG